ncbi:enoyl-CoA hydratase [Rhodococcus jostii]|uniref:enoyl-CoA hydratase n=1 Tax=Rhodococcus jostii TaxID=132919 RepID=UPI00365250DF
MNISTVPVAITLSDGVGVLTLDNPAKRNPLSVPVMSLLNEALLDFASNREVRAVVIRANGPVFSSGHDLSELVDRTLEDEREVFGVCTTMMESIQQIPQPVIAAVNGPAVAAGSQLASSCDLVVASSNAVFGTPGVKLGLFCSTPMVAISRAIGRKRMMQMLLTGEVIDSATAMDWGLVNEVVDPDRLDARVFELAAAIVKASPLTLRVGKQAFYRQIELPQSEAYAEMAEVMSTNAMTCDAQEGIEAFLAKRTPTWTGQ